MYKRQASSSSLKQALCHISRPKSPSTTQSSGGVTPTAKVLHIEINQAVAVSVQIADMSHSRELERETQFVTTNTTSWDAMRPYTSSLTERSPAASSEGVPDVFCAAASLRLIPHLSAALKTAVLLPPILNQRIDVPVLGPLIFSAEQINIRSVTIPRQTFCWICGALGVSGSKSESFRVLSFAPIHGTVAREKSYPTSTVKDPKTFVVRGKFQKIRLRLRLNVHVLCTGDQAIEVFESDVKNQKDEVGALRWVGRHQHHAHQRGPVCRTARRCK